MIISEIIYESWEGLAVAMRNTPTGRIAALGNEFNNIQSTMGDNLMPGIMRFFDIIEQRMPFIGNLLDKGTQGLSKLFKLILPGLEREIDRTMDDIDCLGKRINKPVNFIDPSGLIAKSVQQGQQRNPATGRNRNVYSLYVEPRRLTIIQTAAGVLPGFGLLNWGGQRLAGFRSISMDWTVATGSIMEVASTVIGGKIGVGITAASVGISAAASRPEWQMREAIFNQFDRRIWESFSRDTVDSKFRYSMHWMDGLMSAGLIEVSRAVDHFGSRAFRFDDRIWRFDPLTGSNRYFNQNDWYFFALCDTVHGTIGSAESNILTLWGSASTRMR